MRGIAFLLAILLPAVAGAQGSAGGAVPVSVDRVVAVVGNTPLASSQVLLEEQLGDRIRGERCSEFFGRLLCEEREPLERLIFRETLRQAGLAQDVQVSAAIVEAAEQAFARSFDTRDGKRRFLERWGMEDADFREMVLDVARLDQAIEVTVGRLVREVSEEEERRYHAENIDTIFGGRPYEEVAAMVSRRYYSLKFERTYGAWASELRASIRVRYVGR